MSAIQEVLVAERGKDLRRLAAERRLAGDLAALAIWLRVGAVVAERRRRAEGRLEQH